MTHTEHVGVEEPREPYYHAAFTKQNLEMVLSPDSILALA